MSSNKKIKMDEKVLKNIIEKFGHIYYSLILDAGAGLDAPAVSANISGDISKVINLHEGDEIYFNHLLCESLVPSEREIVKRILDDALWNMKEYTIEFRVDYSTKHTSWYINKGYFVELPEVNKIQQYGFITTVPGTILRRNEFGAADMRYHSIAGLMSDYVFTVRCHDGKVVETIHGGACEKVTGYKAEEFKEDIDLWYKMVHPSDKELILDRANKMARGESVETITHRIKHKDGKIRWVQSIIVPHHDEQGKIFVYDGVIRDITEQKQEQQILEQISYMNELLLDAIPDPMVLMDTDGIVIKANKAGYAMGAKDEESSSLMWQKEVEATCSFRLLLEKAINNSCIVMGEISYLGKWYEATIVPNEPELLLACLHDITQRRRMSDKLEEDKMIMDAVLKNTIASIMILDINGIFENINAVALKIIDKEKEKIIGKSFYEVFPTDFAQQKMDIVREVVISKKARKIEEIINGCNLSTMVLPVINSHQEVIKVAVFSKDTTKQRKAEANLLETYQILTTIIENSPNMIIVLDMERKVRLWNKTSEDITGLKAEDAYDKVIWDLYYPGINEEPEVMKRAYSGEIVKVESADINLKNGNILTCNYVLVPKINAGGKVSGVLAMTEIKGLAPQPEKE